MLKLEMCAGNFLPCQLLMPTKECRWKRLFDSGLAKNHMFLKRSKMGGDWKIKLQGK